MLDKSYTLDALKGIASNLPFEIKQNITLLKHKLNTNEFLDISFLKLLKAFVLDISCLKNKEDLIEAYKFVYDKLCQEEIQIIPMLIPDDISLETELMLIPYLDITVDPSISQAKEIGYKRNITERDLRILKEAKDKMSFYNNFVDVLKNIEFVLNNHNLNLAQQEYLLSLLADSNLSNNTIKLFKNWINFIDKNGSYPPYYKDINSLESKLSDKDLVISILAKIYKYKGYVAPLVYDNYITRTIASIFNVQILDKTPVKKKEKTNADFFTYESLYQNKPFLYKTNDNYNAKDMSFNKAIKKQNLPLSLVEFLDNNIEHDKDKNIFDPTLVKVIEDTKMTFLQTKNSNAPFYIYTCDETTAFNNIVYRHSNKNVLGNIFASNIYLNLFNKLRNKTYFLKRINNKMFNFSPSPYTKILFELIDLTVLVNDIQYKFNNMDLLNKFIPYISILLSNDLHYYFSIVYTIAKKQDFKFSQDKDVLFYLLIFLFVHMFIENDKALKKEINYSRRKDQILRAILFSIKNTNNFYKFFKPILTPMLNMLSNIKMQGNYISYLRNGATHSEFSFNKTKTSLFKKLQKDIPLLTYYLEYELKNNVTYLNKDKASNLNCLFSDYITNNLSNLEQKESIKKYLFLTMLYSDSIDEIKSVLNIMDYIYNKDDSIPLQDIYLKYDSKFIKRVYLNQKTLFEANYLTVPLNFTANNFFEVNTIFSLLHFDKRDVVLDKELYKNISILSYILAIMTKPCLKEICNKDLIKNFIDTISSNKDLNANLYTHYCNSLVKLLLGAKLRYVTYYPALKSHINHFLSICCPDIYSYKEFYFIYLDDTIKTLDKFTNYILQSYLEDKLSLVNLLSFYITLKELNHNLFLNYTDANVNLSSLLPSYIPEKQKDSKIDYKESCNINDNTIKNFNKFIIKNIKELDEKDIYNYAFDIVHNDIDYMSSCIENSFEDYEEIQSCLYKILQDIQKQVTPKKSVNKKQKNSAAQVKEKKKPLALDFSLISQKQQETSEIQDVIGIIKDENEHLGDSIFLTKLDENEHITHSDEAKQNGLEPKVQALLDFIISKNSETIDLNEFKTIALENKFLSHYAPIEMINDYFYEQKEDMLLDLDEENSIIYVTLELLK